MRLTLAGPHSVSHITPRSLWTSKTWPCLMSGKEEWAGEQKKIELQWNKTKKRDCNRMLNALFWKASLQRHIWDNSFGVATGNCVTIQWITRVSTSGSGVFKQNWFNGDWKGLVIQAEFWFSHWSSGQGGVGSLGHLGLWVWDRHQLGLLSWCIYLPVET